MCLFMVKSEGATLCASPSHLSLLTFLSPIQLLVIYFILVTVTNIYKHFVYRQYTKLATSLLGLTPSSISLLPIPDFTCRTLIIFCCLSSLLQFHFQLPQLVNMIKILTIKKGLNSMFPLKRSRELSFHPMTPLNTVKPPLMHSQPPWQICIHYFHFLTFVICQFTAIWLWFPLLQ